MRIPTKCPKCRDNTTFMSMNYENDAYVERRICDGCGAVVFDVYAFNRQEDSHGNII